ncbi:MAG: hypothetical protein ACD_24C00390G0009 [uncultured bacterium]|nr:MAG: hypothetical protein ACD_24C00390G0009 [uncultured bacterium]
MLLTLILVSTNRLLNNKIFLILLLICITIAAFALSFLIRQEQATKTTPMTENKNGTIELKKALVDDAPDFPVYPNSTIFKSYRKSINDKIEYLVIYEVADEVPDIVRWYNKNITESGWTIIQNSDYPEAEDEQILLLRNNKYNLTLVIKDNEIDGKSYISSEFLPL